MTRSKSRLPDNFAIRRAARDDAPVVLELLNRVPLALYGEPDFTEEQMLVWWRDRETQQWVAEGRGGSVVGAVGVSVHDDGREIFLGAEGDADALPRLLSFGEDQAAAVAAPGAVLHTRVEAEDPNRAVWEGAGYSVVRRWFQMAIDLDRELPEPEWPEGVRARQFEAGADDRSAYQADMAAFADHWNFAPMAYERWRMWTLEKPGFDPSLWVLADAEGAVAGFSFNEPHRSGVPGVSRVAALGVLRPWRRRGVGLALLLESFRILRDAVFRESRLEVDAESPTGAVRLYERAGMHVIRTHLTYEKVLVRG